MTARTLLNFIAGEWVSGSGGVFDNVSPVDGTVICRVSAAGEADVDAAVQSARAAAKGDWRRLSAEQRGAILHRVADGIMARFDEFVAAECADTGKPRSLASHLDIPRGAANFRVFADLVKTISCESFQMATPDGQGALNYAIRKPRGVIGIICPWNLPLLLMTWKVGPALASGNAVVVKPSEETPSTANLLAEVMAAAGVPPGVFNVVHGFGQDAAGEFLSRHTGVDAITFTGETRTGAAIMAAGSSRVRPVSLELGGKNPAVVFADCDLSAAVDGVVRSAFENAGQVCLGTERVFVERPVFDVFVERLSQRARALRIGPPEEDVQMGPLISLEHREKVLGYYRQARGLGATIHAGGGVPEMPAHLAGGAWIEPTVWSGLDDGCAVMTEEIFGPCCHVSPFDTEEEVVRRANDTEYGLACSIWTENLSRGLRLSAAIEAGVVWVNAWFLRDLRTPFGGTKMSGVGREGGVHSLEFYTELTNICIKNGVAPAFAS